jgi:dUTP pyrophosphatase
MIIRFKKLHPNAVTPAYSRDGDAAVDLVATSAERDINGNYVYGTGIAVEIPRGCYGQLLSRSSVAKYDLILSNGVGTLDSNFRGEIVFKFKKTQVVTLETYNVGDRIGQLIVLPLPEMSFVEVETLTDTNRGNGAFGSSGN